MKYIRFISSIVIAIIWMDSLHSYECLDNDGLVLYVSPNNKFEPGNNSDRVYSDINDVKRNIRSVKKYYDCKKIKVIIENGYYQLEDTILFESVDSGLKDGNIEYQAESDGGVVLSGLGSIPLSRINKISVNNNINQFSNDVDVYQVNIPGKISNTITFPIDASLENRVERNLPDFFVNGNALKMSRWPENGWENAETKDVVLENKKNGLQLKFKGNLPEIDKKIAFILGFPLHNWAYEYKKIIKFNMEENFIEVKRTKSKDPRQRMVTRWALYNTISGLNSPGSYIIDKEKSQMYFSVDKGVHIDTLQYSSLNKPLIRFDNVKNVSLKGISVIGTTDNGVVVKNSKNIKLNNLAISYMGKNGIVVTGGKEVSLSKANITNTGSSGVYIGGGDRIKLVNSNHDVNSSKISNFGIWDIAYRPGISIFGVGVDVNNNVIFNGPHSGILISGNNHTISKNEIYDVARATGDVGAIYSGRDWTMRGNIIEGNHIHSIPKATKSGVSGIYLDDLFSGTIIRNNILDGIQMCILIGGGRDNIVENNIFINCDIPIWADARGVERSKLNVNNTKNDLYGDMYEKTNIMKNNTEYSKRYPALKSLLSNNPLEPVGNRIYNNQFSCGTDLVKTKYKKRVDWYEQHNNKCFTGTAELVLPNDAIDESQQ